MSWCEVLIKAVGMLRAKDFIYIHLCVCVYIYINDKTEIQGKLADVTSEAFVCFCVAVLLYQSSSHMHLKIILVSCFTQAKRLFCLERPRCRRDPPGEQPLR